MLNEVYYLFVYGSLRSGFRNAAYEYLSRYFSLIGEGAVKAKLFDKGTYPVAVPTEEDKFIKGELYQLNNPAEFAWAMEQIDDYEGLHVEAGEVDPRLLVAARHRPRTAAGPPPSAARCRQKPASCRDARSA